MPDALIAQSPGLNVRNACQLGVAIAPKPTSVEDGRMLLPGRVNEVDQSMHSA